MIRINLLDESEIPKGGIETDTVKIVGSGGSEQQFKKILTGMIAGFAGVLLVYVLYYFFSVGGALGDLELEFAANAKKVGELEPKVNEYAALSAELEKLQSVKKEFDAFTSAKIEWARFLNIVSDELPEEVLVKNISTVTKKYKLKRKTDEGLVTELVPAVAAVIQIQVSEEHQGRVNEFRKRLSGEVGS